MEASPLSPTVFTSFGCSEMSSAAKWVCSAVVKVNGSPPAWNVLGELATWPKHPKLAIAYMFTGPAAGAAPAEAPKTQRA